MSEQFKGYPIPVLTDSYLLFKKEVMLWASITNIEEKKRAGTIALKLPDKAKNVVLDIPPSELADGVDDGTEKKTGLEYLLEVLDTVYLEDLQKEKYNCYDEFRKLKRKKTEKMSDFLLEFEKQTKRLTDYNITLPTEVLAYELLKSANISEEKAALARATCSELKYEIMKTQLKKITEEEILADSIVKVCKEDSDCYFADTGYDESSQYESERFQQPEEAYYNRGTGSRYNRYRSSSSNRRNYYRGSKSSYYDRGYSSGSRSNQNWRGKSNTSQRTNPRDSYGNQMTCNRCRSIYHFANCCPEKQYLNENVTLFQNSPDYTHTTDSMEIFTGENFGLAVLDCGCNKTVCGEQWLNVYIESLSEDERKTVKYEDSHVMFKFGDNEATASTTRVTLPAEICGKAVKIVTQVVKDHIPLLISKQTMRTAKMVLDFHQGTVEAFGAIQKMINTQSGHCSINLQRNSVFNEVCVCSVDNIVMINTCDAKDNVKTALKLHKQFAHPTADRLKTFIRTAGKLTKELSREIDIVTEKCEICRRYKPTKLKPIVCMPLAKDFNECVAMDLKVYDVKNNIYFQHIIDHATRFSTAKVVHGKSKEEIVESVFTNWIAIFGTPDKIMTDNGGEYVNSSFMDMCEKLGVHVCTTGAEAPWSNGVVERHHALLSRNVTKIIEDTNCNINTALAWAVNAKNTLSNINGFSPYQLLFGKNPPIPSLNDPYSSPTTLEDESPSERVAENIKAIYVSRREQLAADADEKIRRALRSKTRDVYSEDLNSGDLVYYKRDDSKRWKGPATITGIDGKLVFVRHGGNQLRCHRARVVNVNDLYNNVSDKGNDSPPENTSSNFKEVIDLMKEDVSCNGLNLNEEARETQDLVTDQDRPPRDTDNSNELHNNEEEHMKEQKLCTMKAALESKKPVIELKKRDLFSIEKEEELQKWKKNEVYEEIYINEITDESILPISTTWVLTENDNRRKARLVARGFEEEQLSNTRTVSPTCRKESMRILLCIAAANNWKLQSLDIASAFLQGKEIDREVYLIPPREYKKPNVLWKLRKCVYGLSDAARMWYMMVREHIEASGIIKCSNDDAFFYGKQQDNMKGVMTIHVDDFVFAGDSDFENLVKGTVLKDFEIKSNEDTDFTYLGLQMSQDEDDKSVTVSQSLYIKELQQIPLTSQRKKQKNHALTPHEYKQFRSAVGQLLWLSLQTRPDVAFEACILGNHLADANVEDIIRLNKVFKKLQQEEDVVLSYKKIPDLLQDCKLQCYSDAAYGNLPRHGSQCGYVIFLASRDNKVKNPIAWKSVKLDRVCQSTLAAESLALAKAVDHTIFIQQTIKEVTNIKDVPIECYVDSKSLVDLVYKTKDPEEKRLIGTMSSLREMVEKGEVTVEYIRSKEMPADVLTKRGRSGDVIKSHLLNMNNDI